MNGVLGFYAMRFKSVGSDNEKHKKEGSDILQSVSSVGGKHLALGQPFLQPLFFFS